MAVGEKKRTQVRGYVGSDDLQVARVEDFKRGLRPVVRRQDRADKLERRVPPVLRVAREPQLVQVAPCGRVLCDRVHVENAHHGQVLQVPVLDLQQLEGDDRAGAFAA